MDWETSLFTVGVLILGYLLGHYFSERSADKRWERDKQVRKDERDREEERRWDKERVAAYSTLWDETLGLVDVVDALLPYWETDETPPQSDLTTYDLQHAALTAAFARAKLLASDPVGAMLAEAWDKIVEIVDTLKQPGTGTAAEFRSLIAQEIGVLLGRFDRLAKIELGIVADDD